MTALDEARNGHIVLEVFKSQQRARAAFLAHFPHIYDDPNVERTFHAVGNEEIRYRNGGSLRFTTPIYAMGRHAEILYLPDDLNRAQLRAVIPVISRSTVPEPVRTRTDGNKMNDAVEP